MRKRNRCRLASDSNQGQLFAEAAAQPAHVPGVQRRVFVEPSPRDLHFGALPLDVYLRNVGEKTPLVIARLFSSLSWDAFEAHYDGTGRPAYAPRLMLGLIAYGMLKGIRSLRGLEMLARTDLGSMWVCGGIQPDHSNLGRFILRHAQQLEGAWFEDVTRRVLKATGADTASVAGDGTVIQAMGSRYRTLKREALDAKLRAAEAECAQVPEDHQKQVTQEKYAAADAALAQREAVRASMRKPTESLRVCTTEPEAPVQPLKNKSYAPSYVPSVLANAQRVIVGKAVEASSETGPVRAMLDEAERIGGKRIEELLVDGNYCAKSVLDETLARDINLLCNEHGDVSRAKKLQKSEFRYDEQRDCYVCPKGQALLRIRASTSGGYVQYSASDCTGCELRGRCLSSAEARGRTIKRYTVDEAKDALREVMSQPRAQAAYQQRKAMVEPVFSYLACRMGVHRFHRRGLAKVRVEFALYAAVYNVGRYVAAAAAAVASFFAIMLVLRLHRAPGHRRDFRVAATAA